MTSSQNIEQKQSNALNSAPNDLKNQSGVTLNALDVIRDEPQLRQAFEQFSEHSMRLEEAYNTLEAQFRQVSAQLHEVYCQLDIKINELATAKQYQEVLLSKISQGVLFIARDQKILTCNHVMSKWLGRGEEDLTNANFKEGLQDDIFGFSIKKALATRQSPQKCFTSLKGNDDLPPLEITTSFIPYFGSDDETSAHNPQEGLCILARSLSATHPSQSASSQDQFKKKMESAPAELVTQLLMALQSIEKTSQSLDENKTSSKEEIGKQSLIATQLLGEFSTFVEPITANLATIELKSVIDEIAQSFNNLKLRVEDLQLLSAQGDQKLFKTALTDLIAQVAAIAEQDHVIVIESQSDGNRAVVILKFENIHIQDEQLLASFSPFESVKTQDGLQLWQINKKIEAMSGHFEVTSRTENSVIFSIFLPLTPQVQTDL